MARCASRWFPIPPRPTFCHDLIWCLDRPGQELAFYTIKASLWKKNHCVDQRRGKRSLNYCVMLCGSSTDEESVMGPPFLLPLGTFPIWKVVIFSLALWYRQYCLPLSQTFNALESDSQVNTNRPSMGGILLSPEWNTSWQSHSANTLRWPSPCPSPFLTLRSMWLHSHIWGFECIYSRAPGTQVGNSSLLHSSHYCKNKWVSESLGRVSSLHSEWAIERKSPRAFETPALVVEWLGFFFFERILVNGFRDGICANSVHTMNDGPS